MVVLTMKRVAVLHDARSRGGSIFCDGLSLSIVRIASSYLRTNPGLRFYNQYILKVIRSNSRGP